MSKSIIHCLLNQSTFPNAYDILQSFTTMLMAIKYVYEKVFLVTFQRSFLCPGAAVFGAPLRVVSFLIGVSLRMTSGRDQ